MYNLKHSKLFFSKVIFSVYDQILIKYVLPLIWKVNSSHINSFYEKHISLNHLDIGSGTGYFINHCKRLPSNFKLTVLDINPICLKICENKLQRFKPMIIEQDILKPLTGNDKYDSIGINLFLHCIPGGINTKELVLKNIQLLLNPGGIIFGTTFILNDMKINFLTRLWGNLFNHIGLLNNKDDRVNELKKSLESNFKEININNIGYCIFFTAGK